MRAARLIHSHSHRALQGAGAAFLAQHRRVLIVAPSRGAADDFVRAYAGAAVAGIERTTLTTLAAQLSMAKLEPGERPASRLAFEALTARILETFRLDSKIPYFQPVADTPGLARAVTSTILELRLNAVSPRDVGKTGAPGRDLAGVLEAFEEESGMFLDLAAILQRASTNDDHPLLRLPVLWLCCEIPSLWHALFAKHVLSKSPHVLALAPTADVPNCEALRSILDVEPEYRGPSTAIERVADSLFAVDVKAVEDRRIRFFSAAGEGLECVEIARNIREIARQGVAFDEIAVLLRSPERYQTLMEEALRRAGIPAYFTRGVARPDPSGRAFLALLACAAEGCSATRFAEYLSLGQVPTAEDRQAPRADLAPDDEMLASFASAAGAAAALEPEEAGPETSRFLASPFAWERLIVDAAVVGGRDRWERRLKGLETELRFKLAGLRRDDPSRTGLVERQIEQVRALSGFALPLIQALGTLPKQARWGEWLDALADLAGQSLKRPESVLSALEELRAMEEIGPVDLGEVYKVLSDRMRFLRREPSKVRYGQVFVAGIQEIRGRSFRAVFVPGLSEGLFPRRASEDPILLDAYRQQLTQPMVDQTERARQERMLLHLAVGSAVEYLYYSYPRMDVMQNRPRVPSFYALELLRATRGKLPELKSFESEAAAHAPTRLDWPAPAHPDEAIDDAEFDLAMLRHATRGGGRYLMSLNPHLVRSLRARAGRWRNRWFPADGFVDGDKAAVEALAKHRLHARAYSPSALQTYAACPYKFLLQAVHRLEAREEPAGIEQLDPLTRGEIFHAVQFQLMQELQAKSGALPVTRENRVDAIAAADRVLDQVARAYADQLAPAIARVWNNEIDELRTDLRAWLIDVSEKSTEWVPAHFELSFGLAIDGGGGGAHDAASSVDPVELPRTGFLVRGSIDLVERNKVNGALRITDHKTGSFPQRPPVFTSGGSVLQPVLYSMAAEQLIPGSQVQLGRLYFCTRKGDYRDVQIRYTPEARDNLEQALQTIDTAIAEGFLPAYPKADACGMCDFRIVCGPYEPERTSRKRKDRVFPLIQLREQP